MPVTTRLVTLDDAPALTDLLRVNRDFLAPWQPVHEESYFTLANQQQIIVEAIEGFARGRHGLFMISDEGALVGCIRLNGITRGAFQSASIGYWIGEAHNGRGYATAAVRMIIEFAFHDLRLHRLQAETLLHNVGSQRVLTACGFVHYGTAASYLKIAGRWQDHHLYQVLSSTQV